MRNEGLFWGIVLVLLGGLLLAQNMGLLPVNVNVWALFWPLVIIVIGARMLLRGQGGREWRDTRWDSGNTPAGSDASRTAEPGVTSVASGPATAAPVREPRDEAVRLPLEGARRARVLVRHGAGELRIDANAAPDELLSGVFAGGLDHRITRSGDELTVDLRPLMQNYPFETGERLDWTMGLNPNIWLALDLEVGASRNLLNLRDLQVRELNLQTGASATQIDFPARGGECRARVRSGAASVDMRIPENVSARIHVGGALMSANINTQRFPQVGSHDYQSPDYEVAANKVDLDIETGMGSVSVQ